MTRDSNKCKISQLFVLGRIRIPDSQKAFEWRYDDAAPNPAPENDHEFFYIYDREQGLIILSKESSFDCPCKHLGRPFVEAGKGAFVLNCVKVTGKFVYRICGGVGRALAGSAMLLSVVNPPDTPNDSSFDCPRKHLERPFVEAGNIDSSFVGHRKLNSFGNLQTDEVARLFDYQIESLDCSPALPYAPTIPMLTDPPSARVESHNDGVKPNQETILLQLSRHSAVDDFDIEGPFNLSMATEGGDAFKPKPPK